MAKSIDPLTRELLCVPTWLERVEQEKISLRWLLSLSDDQKKILQQENRITLIARDKADPQQAIDLPEEIVNLAVSKNLLMQHNLLSVSQLSNMNSETLDLVKTHPQLFHFLMRDRSSVSSEILHFYISELIKIFSAINSIYNQHDNISIMQEQHEYLETIKAAMRSLLVNTALQERDVQVILKKELLKKVGIVVNASPHLANAGLQIKDCIKQTKTLEQREKSLDKINQAWINAFDTIMELLPQQRLTRPEKLYLSPAALVPGSGFFDQALKKMTARKLALICSLALELNNFNREERPAKRRRISGN